MPDAFSNSMSWFNAAMGGNAAVAVIYQRGLKQVPWDATPDGTEWMSQSADTVETWKSRDYVGDPAVLIAGGISMPPLEGDKVIESIGGQSVTHEAVSGNSGQVFAFEGNSGEQRVRVHTKELFRA
jgi:hypothetical protein